jgi:hypothetical protein
MMGSVACADAALVVTREAAINASAKWIRLSGKRAEQNVRVVMIASPRSMELKRRGGFAVADALAFR